MKNTLVLLALSALFLASCSKEDNSYTPANQPQAGATLISERISDVPSAFDQKILLENFTSAANGKCPANDYLIDQKMTAYPGKIYAAAFHRNDIMKTGATAQLFDLAGGTDPLKLPAVMMNRISSNNSLLFGDDKWAALIDAELANKPNCGLAIKSEFDVAANKIKLQVHAGFSTNLPGNYNLCVYLIEDHIKYYTPEYSQANAYDKDEQSPFYGLGNPIPGYIHKNVVRKAVTSINGIGIPATCQIVGGHFIQHLSAVLPQGVNIDDCSVVAFIYDAVSLRVINVQQGKVGTIKDWN